MSGGLIINGNIGDFCDFLDSRSESIGSLLKGKLQDLEQTAMCLAMAVINKMCSNGTSPSQPLHTSVQSMLVAMNRMESQITRMVWPSGNRDDPMSIITDPIATAVNSVIMGGIAQINTAAMQITSFMNVIKGVADSVIKAIELGPAGLVCLVPLLQKVQDIAWLLDMFSGFEQYIDIEATKALYLLTDMMIKKLLGFLFPSLMGCSI